MVITAAPNAVVRRYVPDSVKFADAKPSKLTDINKGDQIRARGDKSPDGNAMKAEEIVSGQFKLTAGVVVSADPGGNIIRINSVEAKRQMTVTIAADSSLKKLPPRLSQLIANRLHGMASAERAQPGAGGGDLQALIDRTSPITVADLKSGDAVIVSSTAGANADQVTAITVLAGVEAILTKPGSREMSLGDWNMGGGGDLGGFGQ